MATIVSGTAAAVAISTGQIDEVPRPAAGALIQLRLEGSIAHMLAVVTPDQISLEVHVACVDLQLFALEQKSGDLVPAVLHEMSERRSGDVHPLERFRMILSNVVRETNRLEFVQRQPKHLEFAPPDTGRLENRKQGWTVGGPRFLGSRHVPSSKIRAYVRHIGA